jgi:hypothetical protein
VASGFPGNAVVAQSANLQSLAGITTYLGASVYNIVPSAGQVSDFAFNTVAGRANNNPTTVPGKDLTNGQRHTSIVQVRNGRVTAYLDGMLIRSYKTDYSEMGEPFAAMKIPSEKADEPAVEFVEL